MLFIKNGHIKTMAGAELANGCILLDDTGRIAAIGEELAPPAGAEIIDAKGRLVTPGVIEAHCHTGIKGLPNVWQNIDHNEVSDPVTPQLRAIDGINPRDEALEIALQYGVTCACSGPGSANVVGGSFAVIKLYGDRIDDMILKYPVAMKCAFGENPKSFHGQAQKKAPLTRMQTAGLLRDLLARTKNYMEQKEAGKCPAYDAKLEAMLPVLKGEIPLKAHAHRADDILTSIRIAKEFGVGLTLDHCTEGHLVAEHIAKEGYPAIVGPSLMVKSKLELQNKGTQTAGILHKAGVKVCITTDAPVIALNLLPMCAGFAARAGLPYEQAWLAITKNPAEILGIADRVGTLEVGKDGDVVIWDDDPLTVVAAAAAVTVINGKVVYKA